MGSNTRFGLALGTACAIVYGWGFWSGSSSIRWLIATVVLLAITLTIPRVLDPLKRLWMRLGYMLHLVVSPLLLGLFYYTAVTPVVMVLRLLGKDSLRLKHGRASYWVEREPLGPEPRTMSELY